MCVRQYFRDDQYNDKNDNKDKDTDKYLKQPTYDICLKSWWFAHSKYDSPPVTFATQITQQGPRHPAGHPPRGLIFINLMIILATIIRYWILFSRSE